MTSDLRGREVALALMTSSCVLFVLCQDAGDGASGRQERGAGATAQISPEASDRHPTDAAQCSGNHG